MTNNIQQVAFKNKNPESQFDLLCLNSLLKRNDIEHSLFDYQKNNFYTILFCTGGQGLHSIDFVDYTHHKRTVLTIRKDQVHKFFKTNAQGFILIFTEDFLIKYFEKSQAQKCLQLFNELISTPKTSLSKPDFDSFNELIAEIEKEYESLADEHSLSIISSFLHVLLNKLLRLKTFKTPLQTAKKYVEDFISLQHKVEQHCFETKRVERYAAMMNVSTKTLNNITQSIINKPAKTFIDEIVILQIKRLLMISGLSIKEIAYRSGFEETTNFYKFFKKYVQATPENFRASYLTK